MATNLDTNIRVDKVVRGFLVKIIIAETAFFDVVMLFSPMLDYLVMS